MLLLGLNFGGSIYPWSSPTVISLVVFGAVTWVLFLRKTSPAHHFFVQADREHRDNVSVLPCFPQKEKY